MPKTLIIQVHVGNTHGYVYDSIPAAKEAASLFNQICVPSVKKYAEKHGYDYKMITEYPQDIDITYFNRNTKSIDHDYSQGGKNKCSTLIRYLALDQSDYESIVTIDCDVWIPEWAEALPEISGHMGVQDKGKVWNIPHHGKFINGGVQMVDAATGKSISKFVRDKVINKVMPPMHTDQAFMNEWRSLNPQSSHVIDEKWNYMVGCHGRRFEYKDVNFVHYAGGAGRGIFLEDLKQGIIK